MIAPKTLAMPFGQRARSSDDVHEGRRSPRVPRRNRFRASLEPLEGRELLTTFVVNSLGDDNVGSGDAGDLRYVINRANALNTGTTVAPDRIVFTGVTITPSDHTVRIGSGAAGATPLPALAAAAIIDGTTANGFNNLTGLLLTLDGSLLRGSANGLILNGGHATVQALGITNFPGHGILVTSSHNKIGGDEVGFNAAGQRNNPAGRITSPLPPSHTTVVQVRPPRGNVISGNGGDGVLIINGANSNKLLGNFIGTDVTGINALGNRGNGVSIINSDSNEVLGTTPPDKDNPFVFYNVISGNQGNGLVVRDSDSTTIYANFFGLAADNRTPLGNRLNGVLIDGTSDQTALGGNIPLGDVVAANGGHGVMITGSASRTIMGNMFNGVAAFNPGIPLGNGQDGIFVDSNGGGRFFLGGRFTTIILTCQSANNGGNGIGIGHSAVGVQVSQSVIGMETEGKIAQPNGRNGIEIFGGASGIAIGGFEPSVEGVPGMGSFLEASNLISGNRRDGVAINKLARDVTIVNSLIGTDISGAIPAGNGRHGISIDGSSGVRIGARLGAVAPRDRNIIAFNIGNGILVNKGTKNGILGNSIFGNGRLGIALNGGGNRNQPAPVLTSARVQTTGATQVTGTLRARPRTTYQVEFFANPSARPGEGQIFLGFATITTNGAGIARFNVTGLNNTNPTGALFISATATSRAADTSKFSRPIAANRNGG